MRHQNQSSSAAFTLTEVMVVIAIIVVVLAMAVPAMNYITGSRSTEAAYNQVSAMLGAARAEAMRSGGTVGVVFFLDQGRDQTATALVEINPSTNAIDLMAGRDTQPLQSGVAAQVLADAGAGERYLRIGVILFDRLGRVVSKPYVVGWNSELGRRLGLKEPDNLPSTPSQYGLVLYDRTAFKNKGFSETDPFLAGQAYASPEPEEEGWLDQNGMLLVVNRYNGTLFKSE